MVNKQMIKIDARHADKLVVAAVIVEDTSPVTQLYVRGMKTRPEPSHVLRTIDQASPEIARCSDPW
jgi:hypothetical protein